MEPSQHDFSSPVHGREILGKVDAELAALTLRSDELRKHMTSLHYWNDPVGNRRVRTRDRRTHEERRRIVRPDGDRRAIRSDRRLPLEVRCETIETELSLLSQRCHELAEVRRKLYHNS